MEGRAADEEALAFLHGLAEGVEAFDGEELRGGVDVVVLRAAALFPVERGVGLVGVAFLLGHGCGQHVGVVFLVDDKVAELVLLQQAWGQLIELEAAAAFPVLRLADAALVGAVGDHLQARIAVGVGVVAQLNADISPAHLLRHGRRGARTEETVENEVAGVAAQCEDTLYKAFWFGSFKNIIYIKSYLNF